MTWPFWAHGFASVAPPWDMVEAARFRWLIFVLKPNCWSDPTNNLDPHVCLMNFHCRSYLISNSAGGNSRLKPLLGSRAAVTCTANRSHSQHCEKNEELLWGLKGLTLYSLRPSNIFKLCKWRVRNGFICFSALGGEHDWGESKQSVPPKRALRYYKWLQA